MTRASIDIGSNTINLLIAKASVSGLETVFFERIPALLGKGGMQQGILTPEAIARGLKALAAHKASCEEYGVTDITTTATSAVRSASNGSDFVAQVKADVGLDVEVISGDREAELIWKGVRLTGLLDRQLGLIMDIGGGSTEFILGSREKILWKKSYPHGVTRLKERFELSDPFIEHDETLMKRNIAEEWSEMIHQVKEAGCQRLIGASGSFNSLSLMLAKGDESALGPIQQEIGIQPYRALSEFIRNSPPMMRKRLDGLVPDRVDTIGYSCALIDLVLDECAIKEVWRSSYALKEGVISEGL